MSERWEKERASWVLARAGHSPAARRRGEKLMVSARRRDRYGVGAGDAAFAEVTTRNAFHRSVFREEGAANTMGWLTFTLMGAAVLAVLAGPAMLVSRVAYGIWWAMVPRWGRMHATPYLCLALLLCAASWLVHERTGPSGFAGFLYVYGAAQSVLGLLWAGWLVRANGWPAVSRKVKQSSTRVAPIRIEAADPADVGSLPAKSIVAANRIDQGIEIEPIEIEDDVEPGRSRR